MVSVNKSIGFKFRDRAIVDRGGNPTEPFLAWMEDLERRGNQLRQRTGGDSDRFEAVEGLLLNQGEVEAAQERPTAVPVSPEPPQVSAMVSGAPEVTEMLLNWQPEYALPPPTLVTGPAETLEAGTWTPVIAGSTMPGSHTYTTQTGRFLRYDGWVWISGKVVLSALGGTEAGNITITGLPYPATEDSDIGLASWENLNLGGAQYHPYGEILTGNAFLTVRTSGDNVAKGTRPVSSLSATTAICINSLYRG